MKWTFKEEVKRAIRDKHHLIPIFTSVHSIPERVYEYDNTFFVVYNTRKEKFEVHCLENKPDTHSFTIPYRNLDIRTMRKLWQNDIRVHGKGIFEEIEKMERVFEKSKEREFKNWVQDVASETKSMFAKDAWLM